MTFDDGDLVMAEWALNREFFIVKDGLARCISSSEIQREYEAMEQSDKFLFSFFVLRSATLILKNFSSLSKEISEGQIKEP